MININEGSYRQVKVGIMVYNFLKTIKYCGFEKNKAERIVKIHEKDIF